MVSVSLSACLFVCDVRTCIVTTTKVAPVSSLQLSAVVAPLMLLQMVNEVSLVHPLDPQWTTPVTQGTPCKETADVPAWPMVIGAEGHLLANVRCFASIYMFHHRYILIATKVHQDNDVALRWQLGIGLDCGETLTCITNKHWSGPGGHLLAIVSCSESDVTLDIHGHQKSIGAMMLQCDDSWCSVYCDKISIPIMEFISYQYTKVSSISQNQRTNIG